MLLVLFSKSSCSPAAFFALSLIISAHHQETSAQTVVNNQAFTNGLSIFNAPALHKTFRAESNLPISIEVPGNGKLSGPSLNHSTGLSTRYDGLEIYLVSSQTNLNMTVSSGSGPLTGKTGSIRNLDWSIPSCIASGQYNLTFYETSHINGRAYFTITPIPISIESNSGTQCSDGVNALETQPQVSAPFDQSPFFSGRQISINIGVSSSCTSSGFISSTTRAGTAFPTGPTAIIIILSSGGGLPFDFLPTATVTSNGPTVTLVSTVTATTTQPGQPIPITTTYTSTRTTVATTSGNSPGFIPVNASHSVTPLTTLSLSWILGAFGGFLVLQYT